MGQCRRLSTRRQSVRNSWFRRRENERHFKNGAYKNKGKGDEQLQLSTVKKNPRDKQPSPSWGDERQSLNIELTTETGVSNSRMESPKAWTLTFNRRLKVFQFGGPVSNDMAERLRDWCLIPRFNQPGYLATRLASLLEKGDRCLVVYLKQASWHIKGGPTSSYMAHQSVRDRCLTPHFIQPLGYTYKTSVFTGKGGPASTSNQ